MGTSKKQRGSTVIKILLSQDRHSSYQEHVSSRSPGLRSVKQGLNSNGCAWTVIQYFFEMDPLSHRQTLQKETGRCPSHHVLGNLVGKCDFVDLGIDLHVDPGSDLDLDSNPLEGDDAPAVVQVRVYKVVRP